MPNPKSTLTWSSQESWHSRLLLLQLQSVSIPILRREILIADESTERCQLPGGVSSSSPLRGLLSRGRSSFLPPTKMFKRETLKPLIPDSDVKRACLTYGPFKLKAAKSEVKEGNFFSLDEHFWGHGICCCSAWQGDQLENRRAFLQQFVARNGRTLEILRNQKSNFSCTWL